RDDFGERVGHDRTLANEMWMAHDRSSCQLSLSCSPSKPMMETPMNPATKTVLITGCSSGYGLETARYFHARGWNVIATMRTPRPDLFPQSERLRVLPLDVTKEESIAAALEASGPIDVL